MVALGLARSDQSARLVTSAGNAPLLDGWQVVTRILGSQLPGTASPRDYVFVVTGEVGQFVAPLTPTFQPIDATAEVMVVEEGFLSPTYRQVVNLNEPNLQSIGRSISFQMIVPGSAWTTSRNLVVLARIHVRGALTFGNNPSFAVSALSVLAWDTTALGSGRFFFDANAHSPSIGLSRGFTTDPPNTIGEQLMLPTNPIPYSGSGEKKWLAFYSVAVVPSTRSAAHSCWMMRLPSGSWGSADEPWGFGDAGAPSMGPNTESAAFGTYHMGLARVVNVTNNSTKIGIRGMSQYPASENPAQALRTTLFAVKVDECIGFDFHEAASVAAFYGPPAAPSETERQFTLDDAIPYVVLHTAVPKNEVGPRTGRSFRAVPRHNGREAGVPPLHIYQHEETSGIPHVRVSTIDATDDLNIASMLCAQNIAEDPVETHDGSSLMLVTGYDPVSPIRITIGAGHSLVDGDRINIGGLRVFAIGGQGGVTIANGNWTVRRVDSTRISLLFRDGSPTPPDPVGNTYRDGGTIAKLRDVPFRGAWTTAVGFAMTDTALESSIPDEVEGPEIEILPGTEALGLGSLAALPVQPSFSVPGEVNADRVDMQTLNGYRVTWPRSLRIRGTLDLTWTGITETQFETLVAFFEANPAHAFKWVRPGDIERAYVLTTFDLEGSDLKRRIYSVSASVAELALIG